MTHIQSLTANEFDARYELLICDADGTLRRCNVGGQPYPNQQRESMVISEAARWLSAIDWAILQFGITSHHSNVGLGYKCISEVRAYTMLTQLASDLIGEYDVNRQLIQLRPSNSHKLKIAALNQIMSNAATPPNKTLMVGTHDDDRIAAGTALCDFIWAWDLFSFDKPETETT